MPPHTEMMRWQRSDPTSKWEEQPSITIPEGPFNSVLAAQEQGMIYLSKDKTVLAIDALSGHLHRQIEFDVGERAGGIWADPIQCIAILNDPQRVACGLHDSCIAVVRLGDDG